MREKENRSTKKIQLSDHFDTERLLRFAAPTIWMMVFTSVYGVVDGFFVSNFVGKTPFAAVNLIIPLHIIMGSVGYMLGIGGSALIGKLLGEGRKEKANGIFSMLICVSTFLGIIIGLAGIAILRPAAVLLGADESMLGYCLIYGRIVMAGMPASILQYAFQSFFPAAEKPKLGFYVTVFSGVMNMVLDALLVGALSWGIPGAAVATVMSQTVGAVVPIFYFAGANTSLLRIGKPDFDVPLLLKSMGNGASEFVADISMSTVGMLYNMQLMRYAGEDGVAAYGVLMYVSMIFCAILIGYSAGCAPIISFHYGAGDTKELTNLLRRSLKIVLVVSVLMAAASEMLAGPLSLLFVGYDARLMEMTLHAFRIYSFAFLFCGVPIFGSLFFTALNDGFTSAAISFLRTLVFQVAAVLLLPMVMGIEGIWYSLIVAEVTAGAVTVFFLVRKREKYGY